jgi:hypothetical protein
MSYAPFAEWSYTFAGCGYGNSRSYHDAIAAEWLCAGGLNTRETMLEVLSDNTDEDLAKSVVAYDGWNSLNDESGFSVEELAEATGRLRQNFDSVFPIDE